MWRVIKIFSLALVFFAAAAARAETDGSFAPAASAADERQSRYARLSEELRQIEAGLSVKREELARLRRKWVAVKGRTPTTKEIKKYEQKLAEGKARVEDNPYMNKSPLSSPGPYREAYYRKLNEIREDEERVAALREKLAVFSR